jgi:hypothetical protein
VIYSVKLDIVILHFILLYKLGGGCRPVR